MNEYTVEENGRTYTAKLSDEDAKRLGAKPVKRREKSDDEKPKPKKAAPANKARKSTSNK